MLSYPSLLEAVLRVVAQLGRALRSGRRGRRFKSCQPDQNLQVSRSRLTFLHLGKCQLGGVGEFGTASPPRTGAACAGGLRCGGRAVPGAAHARCDARDRAAGRTRPFAAASRKAGFPSRGRILVALLVSAKALRTKNRPRWQVLTVRGCRAGRPLRRCRTRFAFRLAMAPSCRVAFPRAPILPGRTTPNRQNLPARAVFRARPMGEWGGSAARGLRRRRTGAAGASRNSEPSCCPSATRGRAAARPGRRLVERESRGCRRSQRSSERFSFDVSRRGVYLLLKLE